MFQICSELSKRGLKIYYFCQHLNKAKGQKNCQMAKPIYFWKTVLKKAKFDTFDLQTGQMVTLDLLLCDVNQCCVVKG